MTSEQSKYKAFISYSHQDKKWGDWLHKALETYRVPKGLIGKQTRAGVIPKRLFPIFRDREELPTSHELGKVIDQALRDSSHLVIICSPRSAKSLWVNEEIKQFKRLGKSDNILCLIVDGEPNAADKPGLEEEECFPEAAKYEIGQDGELSTIRTEPIAADAREGKDGKRNSLLKLVAGLLAVGFDDIKQRDAARRKKRFILSSVFFFILVTIFGALSFWSYHQRENYLVSQEEAERSKYLNAIGLARQKINDDRHDQARELLWATPERFRHWEWGHLLSQTNPELHSFGGFFTYAKFAPDGRHFLTGDNEKFQMRELISGKVLYERKSSLDPEFFPTGYHFFYTARIDFSPNGKMLSFIDQEGRACIIEVESGEKIHAFKPQSSQTLENSNMVHFVQFSPAGERFGFIGGGVASIADVDSGEIIFSRESKTLDFSSDGKRVITLNPRLQKAEIWDVQSGKSFQSFNFEDFAPNEPQKAEFSPNGHWLLLTDMTEDGNVQMIFDSQTGQVPSLFKNVRWLRAVFSPHGEKMIVWGVLERGDGSESFSIILDSESLEVLHSFSDELSEEFGSAFFSPDGQTLMTFSENRSLPAEGYFSVTGRIWNLSSLDAEPPKLMGRIKPTSVTFSEDNEEVIIGSSDGMAMVWNLRTGEMIRTLHGHKEAVFSAFSPGGKMLLTWENSLWERGTLKLRKVKLWKDERQEYFKTLIGHDGPVRHAGFSKDGQRIVTTGEDGTVKTWDAENAKMISSLQVADKWNKGFLTWAVFSGDGKQVAVSSLRLLYILNLSHGEISSGKHYYLRSIGPWPLSPFFKSGDLRVSVSTGNGSSKIQVFDSAKRTGEGEELLGLSHFSGIYSVQSSTDGKLFVSASQDGTAKVWDSKGEDLRTLDNHTDAVLFASFSEDNQRVVTASKDRTARIWDVASGNELHVLKGHAEIVGTANFSPDGERVITGSNDGMVKIWDSRSGNELISFQVSELHDSNNFGARRVDGLSFKIAPSFSPDGSQVIAKCPDGKVKIWQVTNWAIGREEYDRNLRLDKNRVSSLRELVLEDKNAYSKDRVIMDALKVAVEIAELNQVSDPSGNELYLSEDQTPYSGWIKDAYEKGRVRLLGRLKDGKKDGFWYEWYDNGRKASETKYLAGRMDGVAMNWYANGQKKVQRNFKDVKSSTFEVVDLKALAKKQKQDEVDELHRRIAQDFFKRLRLQEIDDGIIQIEGASEGIKVTLFDRDKKPFFEKSSTRLTSKGKKIMQRISWLLSMHVHVFRVDSYIHYNSAGVKPGSNSTPAVDKLKKRSLDLANEVVDALLHYSGGELEGKISKVTGHATAQSGEGQSSILNRIEINLKLDPSQVLEYE